MPALAIQPLAATLRAAATLLQAPSAINLTLSRDDVLQWLQISRTIGEVPPALHVMMCPYMVLLSRAPSQHCMVVQPTR
jgi:alpha-D-ribose 1-methylphosphonate 5-triphosphate synthase subunit PhnH